jgi:glyoxylase-like metal-dependent hydrolase (beta-lactamase superfamily II)
MFISGASGAIRVPVPAYVIEHAGSVVVFDTGMHPGLRTDPAARIGGLAKAYVCDMPDGTALDERLASLDIGPDDVDSVIASHLHFDHAGGCALLPAARLVVQRTEWDEAMAVNDGAVYNAHDFDCGHDRQLLDGEHDLFGDGRAVLIPTPGHTIGHQSLRLRLDDGREVVLCSDACYLRQALDDLAVPPFGHDLDQQRESMLALRALEATGAQLVFGHDPDQWPVGAADDRIVELS